MNHLGCDIWGVTSDSSKSHIYYSGCQQIWQLNIATGERSHIAGFSSGNTRDGTGYSPTNTAAIFNYPRGITFLNDKLYIMQSGRIRVIDISGGVGDNEGVVETLNLTFSGYSSLPQFYYSFGGITTDGTHLYVAGGKPRIHKINLQTMTATRFAGSDTTAGTADGQGSNARFQDLRRMTSDGTNIYVAARHAIRKINVSTAQVTTIAGSINTSGSADGIGTSASFKSPYDLHIEGSYLYVSDRSNNKVRRIDLS